MESRLLTKIEAIAYCGSVSVSTFDRYVRNGLLPQKIIGTQALWDRKAIDARLDRISGLASHAATLEDRTSHLNTYLEQLGADKS
jgi:predicted DNA-binding transcriptional regulator AlpA